MAFCTKCGKELDDSAAFCPECGAPHDTKPQEQNTQPQGQYAQQTPPATGYGMYGGYSGYAAPQSGQYQPGQYQNSQYQPGQYQANQYQNPQYNNKPKRPKHITFIFVNTLVFLILLSISVLGSIFNYNTGDDAPKEIEIVQKLFDSQTYLLFALFASFAFTLVMMIVSALARGHNISPKSRAKKAKVLFIISFIALASVILLMITEINYIQCYNKVWKEGLFDPSVKKAAYTPMVFDVSLIAFGIANILKSMLFKKNSIAVLNALPQEEVA